MSAAKIKKKLCFNWGQFFSALILWCCGIVLDMLPILYKVINMWLSSTQKNHWGTLFWSDIEFIYINFNVAFLLFLELFFLRKNNRKVSKVLGGILIAVTLVLIITYTIACFSIGWETHVTTEFMKTMNVFTLSFIIILGIIYFMISSSEITREVIK